MVWNIVASCPEDTLIPLECSIPGGRTTTQDQTGWPVRSWKLGNQNRIDPQPGLILRRCSNFEFVNLTWNHSCPDRRVQNSNFNDIQNLSEVLNTVDCVVSVDTCVPHLALVKGIKTLVLRSLPSEWRFGDGSGSASYPTDLLTVFVQKERGRWDDPVQRVVQELQFPRFED